MAPNAHGWPTFHLDSTLIVVRCPKPVTGIRVVSRHFSHHRVPRNNAVRVVVFLNNDRASRCDIGANRQGIGQYRIDIDAVKTTMRRLPRLNALIIRPGRVGLKIFFYGDALPKASPADLVARQAWQGRHCPRGAADDTAQTA